MNDGRVTSTRPDKQEPQPMAIAIETIGTGDADTIFLPSQGMYHRVNHRTNREAGEIVVRSRRAVDGLTSRRVSVVRYAQYSERGNLLDDWYAVRDQEHSRYDGGRNVDVLIGRWLDLDEAKSAAEKLWAAPCA